jgi:hypothetical protein
MVSQFWLNMFTGFANSSGLSAAGMCAIVVFTLSISFSIAIIFMFNVEHKKNLGVVSFLSWLTFFTFAGALDWYSLALVFLIFFGVWEYTQHKEGS